MIESDTIRGNRDARHQLKLKESYREIVRIIETVDKRTVPSRPPGADGGIQSVSALGLTCEKN